jgi:hypothetical protein
MKIIRTTLVAQFALILVALGGPAVLAEQYRVFDGETPAVCQSGTQSDPVTIEGDRDVKIARGAGDAVNAAVCVPEGSGGAIHVRWQTAGYWKSSGNIGHGCAEILGASKIKVRPVNTNFQQVATYYTCVQE